MAMGWIMTTLWYQCIRGEGHVSYYLTCCYWCEYCWSFEASSRVLHKLLHEKHYTGRCLQVPIQPVTGSTYFTCAVSNFTKLQSWAVCKQSNNLSLQQWYTYQRVHENNAMPTGQDWDERLAPTAQQDLAQFTNHGNTPCACRQRIALAELNKFQYTGIKQCRQLRFLTAGSLVWCNAASRYICTGALPLLGKVKRS